MSDDFAPIPAFKDQFGVEFTTAYGWNLASIIDFLKKVSENPAQYKAPVARKTEFELLYTNIDKLKQGGTMYTTPAPTQQMLRTATAVAPSTGLLWGSATISQRFFIIFDLLGIFLSLMGVPPSTTTPTAKNYSLPLVSLYGKWCQVLAANTIGENFTPSVTQITWGKGTDGTFYPFLGASCAGFAHDSQELWKNLAQKQRWDYINTILKSPYKDLFDTAPVRRTVKFKTIGQRFGNCAETYPFLYILSVTAYVQNCYGIALDVSSVQGTYSKEAAKQYWDKPKGILKPPCGNCSQILEWYGLTTAEISQKFKQWA